ncbi:hypothetical protein [Halostreptopolyspora alba]|uniref:hypothetical protein n=1 Tax=Halostreptopolyspora alba TaxID=2487137 RepID=UPI0011CEB710
MRGYGIDVTVLSRLNHAKTFSVVHTRLDREESLANEAAAISDALFTIIGTLSNSPSKPRPLGLRRAIHQKRLPDRHKWSTETAERLPASPRARVTTWAAKARERREALGEPPALREAEVEDTHAELQDIAMDAPFQRGLPRDSPTLFEVPRPWLTDPLRPRRSSLVRLTKYAVRAATKTSPFSTFTASGRAGGTTDSTPATRLATPGSARSAPTCSATGSARRRGTNPKSACWR